MNDRLRVEHFVDKEVYPEKKIVIKWKTKKTKLISIEVEEHWLGIDSHSYQEVSTEQPQPLSFDHCYRQHRHPVVVSFSKPAE